MLSANKKDGSTSKRLYMGIPKPNISHSNIIERKEEGTHYLTFRSSLSLTCAGKMIILFYRLSFFGTVII